MATRLYLSPWRELDTLTQRLSNFYGGDLLGAARAQNGGWSPAINIEETPEALLLTAELPGLTAENVELQIENGVLTLRGEKREERSDETEKHRYHVWERSHGSFSRSFTLPRSVRADEISAGFQNGVLRVQLPKSAEARSRRIAINGAAQGVQAGRAGVTEPK